MSLMLFTSVSTSACASLDGVCSTFNIGLQRLFCFDLLRKSKDGPKFSFSLANRRVFNGLRSAELATRFIFPLPFSSFLFALSIVLLRK